ncbi:MAG: hypothetical protein ACOC32_05015 [Nanoarchaeota archaeon]
MERIEHKLPQLAEKHLKKQENLKTIEPGILLNIAQSTAEYLRTADFKKDIKPETHFRQ